MINTLLAVTAAATIAAAQPQTTVTTYTAYTPSGAAVTMISTDPSRYDDDKILYMDEGAEIYICMECANDAYTLYTIDRNGIVEMWGYGKGTYGINDDIIADWQHWDYPNIHNTVQR